MTGSNDRGWSKPGDEIPQPVGVVLGGNIQHADFSQVVPGHRVLSPGQASELGIDTSPVFVISPVPRALTPDATPTEQTTSGKATNPKEDD